MVGLMSQAVEEGLAFIPDARLVRDFDLTFQQGDPSSERERWVHKPCIGGDSRGVQLLRLRDLRDLREGRAESGDDDGWLVQKFVRDPFLIRGRKVRRREQESEESTLCVVCGVRVRFAVCMLCAV